MGILGIIEVVGLSLLALQKYQTQTAALLIKARDAGVVTQAEIDAATGGMDEADAEWLAALKRLKERAAADGS